MNFQKYIFLTLLSTLLMGEALYEQNGGNQKLEKVGIFMINALQGYQIDKKNG
jgi:hypothetical protein